MVSAKKLLKSMKESAPKVVPIATDMVLPNYSGARGSKRVDGNFRKVITDVITQDNASTMGNYIEIKGDTFQWGQSTSAGDKTLRYFLNNSQLGIVDEITNSSPVWNLKRLAGAGTTQVWSVDIATGNIALASAAGNVGIGISIPTEKFHVDLSGSQEALIGDPTTHVKINSGGDMFFVGAGSGLPFGDLYVHANAAGQIIATATLTQVTTFDTNGESNLTTPDHTTDDITISKTGKYLITLSSAFSGDPNVTWLGGVYKNNGATQLANLQTKRKLGAGGDVGSVSISGIASLTANDTVEVWFEHAEGVNKSITVEELTLSVVMIGG